MGRLQYSADGTYVCSSANSLGKKRHVFPLCLFQSLYGFGGAWQSYSLMKCLPANDKIVWLQKQG
jgi:hypothetical protein